MEDIINLYEFIEPCKKVQLYSTAKKFLKLAEKSFNYMGADCYENEQMYRFQVWLENNKDNALDLIQFVCDHNKQRDIISVTFNDHAMSVCVTINFLKKDIEEAKNTHLSLTEEGLPF